MNQHYLVSFCVCVRACVCVFQVWAVDNRRLTYVRVGISEAMPLGKEWVHVPGQSDSSLGQVSPFLQS